MREAAQRVPARWNGTGRAWGIRLGAGIRTTLFPGRSSRHTPGCARYRVFRALARAEAAYREGAAKQRWYRDSFIALCPGAGTEGVFRPGNHR